MPKKLDTRNGQPAVGERGRAPIRRWPGVPGRTAPRSSPAAACNPCDQSRAPSLGRERQDFIGGQGRAWVSPLCRNSFLEYAQIPRKACGVLPHYSAKNQVRRKTESGVIQLFALNVYQSRRGPNLGRSGASSGLVALGFGFCKAIETFWLARPMMRRCQSRSARRAT